MRNLRLHYIPVIFQKVGFGKALEVNENITQSQFELSRLFSYTARHE